MNSPPQQSVDHAQFSIRGDVSIHPSAVIASEVLIQAEENSRIVIGAGVCIGMGTILHAYEGTLEIGERAILGAGVLILGQGQIGTEACIGAVTTIFNSSVQPKQVIPAKSLLGDPSFQLQEEQVLESSSKIKPETLTQPQKSSQTKRSTESTKIAISETSIEFESSTEVTSEPELDEQNLDQISQEQVNQNIPETEEEPIQKTEKEQPDKQESDEPKKAQKPSKKTNQVYGQVYLNQMLIKLLPHRQSLEDTSQDLNDED